MIIKKYRKLAKLILFLSIIGFSSPALAEQPVTVENNPQNFKNTVAENTVASTPAQSIDDLNKINGSLKRDINVLVQQVNNLSNEINGLKTSKEEGNDLQKLLEDNW